MTVLGVLEVDGLPLLVHEVSVAAIVRVEFVGAALRDAIQPPLPLAVAVGLMLEELQPGERTRVFNVLGRRVHAAADLADELGVELAVEVELVPTDLEVLAHRGAVSPTYS